MAVKVQTIEFRALGRLDWDAAMREQERVAEARARGECPDTVLFVEHEPVYTYGLRFRRENFRLGYDPSQPTYCGIPVRRAYRGGELTYHGPGQLAVYPILRLPRGGQHLRHLVEFYQAVVIEVLRELGISGSTRNDAPGVWTDRGKIASIGVGLRRGVTRNGFAINVETDLRAFEPIVACGRDEPVVNIQDFFDSARAFRVGTAHELPRQRVHGSSGHRISVDEVAGLVEKHFIRLSNAWLPTTEGLSP